MYVTRAIKITMDKTSKFAKDIFKNPEKLVDLKKRLSAKLDSKEFKTMKIVFETGTAVGGVIMFFTILL